MNSIHSKLFANLMTICQNPNNIGKFFFTDVPGTVMSEDGKLARYRIFNYHIAAYSDWLQPGATFARGHMFEIDDERNPIRLACCPPEKFFNLYENPFTMDIKPEDVIGLADKADGSLISTYLDNGHLRLKSKGSLTSDQANAAYRWLAQPGNHILMGFLTGIVHSGYTVNMEWCAPNNRIVLEYPEPSLKIHSIYNNNTLEMLSPAEYINANHSELFVEWFDPTPVASNPNAFDEMRKQTGVEGWVMYTKDRAFKLKTDWYVTLHRCKDSVNNNKALVTTILENAQDDLYAMFHDDPETLGRIKEFEQSVTEYVAVSWAKINREYVANNHMDRKGYALAGQKAFKNTEPGNLFGVYMRMYQGGSTDCYDQLIDNLKKDAVKLTPAKYLIEDSL
ncbi:RNA ligase and tail fiber protein attachment catalyst [Vibrio phage EniLVp02]